MEGVETAEEGWRSPAEQRQASGKQQGMLLEVCNCHWRQISKNLSVAVWELEREDGNENLRPVGKRHGHGDVTAPSPMRKLENPRVGPPRRGPKTSRYDGIPAFYEKENLEMILQHLAGEDRDRAGRA